MSQLLHIADRVINRPLMILPDKLALIASVLEGRIGIDATEFKGLDIDASLREGPHASRFVGSNVSEDGQRYKPYRVSNGVASIPVLGSLVNRGAWVGAKSGMTSYEGLAYQLDQAASDTEVKSIVLDIDSPGGEAVGAFEIADKVSTVAKAKPVTAVVNGMAASAAYAIASAASQIVATPSGVAGSIGVVLMHADYSHALHTAGVKPTLIHAGAHKVDGNPYEPLSSAVRADLQAEVDHFYDLFVSSVAKGRKGRMTDKSIRGTEARTFIGQAAVDAGLVDQIGSFETVLADLSKRGISSASKKRSSGGGLALDDRDHPTVHAGPTEDRETQSRAGLRAGPDSKPTGLRSAEHCAELKTAAGSDGRQAKFVTLLCSYPYEACSQAAALTAIEMNKRTLARNDTISLTHKSGLYLDPKLSVRGGPLFAPSSPASTGMEAADHGWGDVVDSMNKKLRNN